MRCYTVIKPFTLPLCIWQTLVYEAAYSAFIKRILALHAHPGTFICATGTLSSKEYTQPIKSVS